MLLKILKIFFVIFISVIKVSTGVNEFDCDFDKNEIEKMDVTGLELMKLVVKKVATGCRDTVETLASQELAVIENCLERIRLHYEEELKKLQCKAEKARFKTENVNCVQPSLDQIVKAGAKSQIQVSNIRDTFVKQVLAFSNYAVKNHDQLQKHNPEVLITLRECYQKCLELRPLWLCLEEQSKSNKERTVLEDIYHSNLRAVEKAGENLVTKAHTTVMTLSDNNQIRFGKIAHKINQCLST